MSIAIRKPSREESASRPCRSSFGAKAIAWSAKSSFPQVLLSGFKYRLKVTRLLHVTAQEDLRLKFLCKRLDISLRLIVAIRDGEFGTHSAERFRTTIGE